MINAAKGSRAEKSGVKPTFFLAACMGSYQRRTTNSFKTPGSRGAFGCTVPAGLMHRLVYKFGSNANWIKAHHAVGISTLFDGLHMVSIRHSSGL